MDPPVFGAGIAKKKLKRYFRLYLQCTNELIKTIIINLFCVIRVRKAGMMNLGEQNGRALLAIPSSP